MLYYIILYYIILGDLRSLQRFLPAVAPVGEDSGGTTCLTLLVYRRLSSKVANMLANYGEPGDTIKSAYNK